MLAQGPALCLARPFFFPFENDFQLGWRYAIFITRSVNSRRIGRSKPVVSLTRLTPDDQLVRSVTPHILVSALRKDKASFHQGTLVSVISRGTTIETSQGLFLRTTLPTPLVQLPHDINYTPDFELESLTIVEVPDV